MIKNKYFNNFNLSHFVNLCKSHIVCKFTVLENGSIHIVKPILYDHDKSTLNDEWLK